MKGAGYGHREILGPEGNPQTCAGTTSENSDGDVYFESWRGKSSCWSEGFPPGAASLIEESSPAAAPPSLPAGTPSLVVPYQAPSNPLLSSTQLRAIASTYAAQQGEQSPSAMQAVQVSRANAFRALGGVTPSNPTGALASWLSRPSYVIELHGNFTLGRYSKPAHSPELPISGRVLAIAIDGYTGEVLARSLTEAPISGFASLGAVEQL